MELTRISLLRLNIRSFFQFVRITASIDVHYYLFHGEDIPQQGELAQMVEHSRHMRQVLGSIPRFSNHQRACNSFLPQEDYVETDIILGC